MSLPPHRRTLVVIPTYDEAVTLPTTVRRLRAAVPTAEVLVVDDDSPDGTGRIADALAGEDPAVHVLHRQGRRGLGLAYVAGFGWALERGYDVVVEMDADGSHQPEELPRLLDALNDDVALVIGSRWVPGGRVDNWPRHRMVLSRAGNAWTRVATGLPLRDATAGFRAFTASTLRRLPLADVASQGYCFQVDLAVRVHGDGGVIREVPIRFVERTEGRSKMSRQIVAEAFVRVTVWGATRRARRLGALVTRVARRGSTGHGAERPATDLGLDSSGAGRPRPRTTTAAARGRRPS